MLRFGTVLFILLALAPSAAHAQAAGIRGGFTDDPDSIFLGGHLAFQGVGNVPEIRIEPALELGVGEVGPFDFFSLRFGANAKYMFALGQSGFYAYPLLGASLYYINLEDDLDCGRFDDDCDELEAGIQLGGGFEVGGFAVDLYVGVPDIPDITIALLYTF